MPTKAETERTTWVEASEKRLLQRCRAECQRRGKPCVMPAMVVPFQLLAEDLFDARPKPSWWRALWSRSVGRLRRGREQRPALEAVDGEKEG